MFPKYYDLLSTSQAIICMSQTHPINQYIYPFTSHSVASPIQNYCGSYQQRPYSLLIVLCRFISEMHVTVKEGWRGVF